VLRLHFQEGVPASRIHKLMSKDSNFYYEVRDIIAEAKAQAEAQAQVRRQQEARQTREARQAAVRQQAELFSRLAQAHQVLQQSPMGIPAWERAQREQQEIERQITALRQPTLETAPQRSQPSPSQKPPAIPRPLAWQAAWAQLSYRDQVLAMAQALDWPDRWGTLAGKSPIWRERVWRLLWNSPQTTTQQIYDAYEWLRPHFQA
jgi:hypothetical protein